MEWLISHMEDADIDAPLEQPKPAAAAPAAAAGGASEESIAMLCSMGFSRAQALKALQATQNNIERATEWIFSHAEDSMDVEGGAAPVAAGEQLPDGSGKYKLVAFISHMGTSTLSGHYVCHILVDGKWVLFNDRKVSACAEPPKDMAYMYFYQRMK